MAEVIEQGLEKRRFVVDHEPEKGRERLTIILLVYFIYYNIEIQHLPNFEPLNQLDYPAIQL